MIPRRSFEGKQIAQLDLEDISWRLDARFFCVFFSAHARPSATITHLCAGNNTLVVALSTNCLARVEIESQTTCEWFSHSLRALLLQCLCQSLCFLLLLHSSRFKKTTHFGRDKLHMWRFSIYRCLFGQPHSIFKGRPSVFNFKAFESALKTYLFNLQQSG